MRASLIRRSLALGVAAASLLATPALASGGSGSGGGGGGGSTATDPAATTKSAPCVQINNLAPSADQSVVTDGAWLSASATVSRCGGNNPSFNVLLSAVDAAGNDVLAGSAVWYPTKSLPFSVSRSTESAAFATAYQVSVRVVVPETGAVVASATRSLSTPDQRVATCASVSNLGGTAGYYPGRTTDGALWLSDSIRNCGGREQLDIALSVINNATGSLVQEYDMSPVVAANDSAGIGLLDVEPVPTGTPYTVKVEVHRHSTGELLDNRSIDLATPPAR